MPLGQGIGRATALRLADDGFDVAVNDVSDGNLKGLFEEIKAKGRQSSIHVADVSVDKQVKEMIDSIVKDYGGLDVVSQ